MSTTHAPASDARTAPTDEADDADTESTAVKQQRLADYLHERAADGEVYFKSKFIADDVDLSAKEIGALIVNLQESVTDLSIERWSYTGATTWRVEQSS